MTNLLRVMALMFLLCLLVACNRKVPMMENDTAVVPQSETVGTNIPERDTGAGTPPNVAPRKDPVAASDVARTSDQKAGEYKAQAERRFNELDVKIDQLKEKATVVQKRELGKMDAMSSQARSWLNEMKTATGDKWENAKTKFETSMAELEQTYETTLKR
jgi:hypothetical protein